VSLCYCLEVKILLLGNLVCLDLVSWIVAQLGLNVNRHDAIQYSHWLSNLIQFSKSI